MDENNGVYEFLYEINPIKKIYVCSDLEGGNNFIKAGEILDNQFSKTTIETMEKENIISNKDMQIEVFSELEKNFTFDKGIISEIIQPSTALAYTGDIFDNRPYSLKLLINMIQIKETNPKRVIIIGGNRDFNKLRLGIELFLIKDGNESITTLLNSYNTKTNPIESMLQDNKIGFNEAEPPDYLPNNEDDQIIDKLKDDNSDPLRFGAKVPSLSKNYTAEEYIFYNRVKSLLLISMGANWLSTMIEIRDIMIKKELLLPDEILSNEEIIREIEESQELIKRLAIFNKMCKFYCILIMVMYFEHDLSIKIVSELDVYNGLIYKYFKYMHPVAMFKIGTKSSNKTGLLTHSGLPPQSFGDLEKVFLGIPFGYKYIQGAHDINIKELIRSINSDWREAVGKIEELKISINHIDKNITKYIIFCGWDKEAFAINTPIMARALAAKNNYTKLQDLYIGGTRETNYKTYYQESQNNIKSKWNFSKTSDENKILDYHIFGHEPQKWFPGVNISTEGTNHIALDVCRNDDGKYGTNYYSFAMLKIENDTTTGKINDFILGRTLFGDLTEPKPSDPPIGENKKFKNKIIYYNNPIKDFKFELTLPDNMTEYTRDLTPFNLIDGYRNIYNFIIKGPGSERSIKLPQPSTAQPGPAEPIPPDKNEWTSIFRKFLPGIGGAKKNNSSSSNKKCKHICGSMCKKCHKHDFHCMLKCELCEEEKCHKKHKSRKLKKKRKVTKRIKKRRHYKSRKNTKKRR